MKTELWQIFEQWAAQEITAEKAINDFHPYFLNGDYEIRDWIAKAINLIIATEMCGEKE